MRDAGGAGASHHHVTLVMLAHSFLTLETLRNKGQVLDVNSPIGSGSLAAVGKGERKLTKVRQLGLYRENESPFLGGASKRHAYKE